MRAIHGGYELEAVQADLEVVREAFQDAGDRAAELMQSHDTTSKPSTSWVRTEPTPTEAAIIRFIQSPLGQLRRPVTVWRGESPSTHRTSFTAAAREAQPGHVLTRVPIPLSTSLSPRAAANPEFCPYGTGSASLGSGWLLKIRVERLLYVGDRDDGLADEQEAVIYAPQLLVDDVYEAVVTPGKLATRYVQVIACHPIVQALKGPTDR